MEKPSISPYSIQCDYRHFYSDDEKAKIKEDWIRYIDCKYSLGYSEETTCTRLPNGSFHHFGIHPKTARMYGSDPSDILKCIITIIDDHIHLRDLRKNPDYNTNCTDYLGWVYYNDNDDRQHGIVLIRPNIKVFGAQFAGGGDSESDIQMGKIVRLKVDLI